MAVDPGACVCGAMEKRNARGDMRSWDGTVRRLSTYGSACEAVVYGGDPKCRRAVWHDAAEEREDQEQRVTEEAGRRCCVETTSAGEPIRPMLRAGERAPATRALDDRGETNI